MPQRKTPGATEYTLSPAFLCYANVTSFRNKKKGPTRQGRSGELFAVCQAVSTKELCHGNPPMPFLLQLDE